MSGRTTGWLWFAPLALIWLLSGSLFSVSEMEQALLIRLGAPIGAMTQPGLQFKLPLLDSVIYYDSRLLTLEPPLEQVILGDQKRVEVKPMPATAWRTLSSSTKPCVPFLRPSYTWPNCSVLLCGAN